MGYDIPPDHSTGPSNCDTRQLLCGAHSLPADAAGNCYKCREDQRKNTSNVNAAPNHERPETPPAPPKEKSNLHLLNFDPSSIEAAADFLERNLVGLVRYNLMWARVQRERFSALVAVGFTPEQALELINATNLMGAKQ